jgi:hypothetical protein
MTATATPVSAATEQEHQHNNDEDQFHGNSPLMTTALFAAHQIFQRRLKGIVPEHAIPNQNCGGVNATQH